eukprot:7672540-Karenia_brevis.AAC.1
MRTWTRRKRQGLVPDFMAAVPGASQTPSDAVHELWELKTLHHGTSTYPVDVDARCAAVNRRARAVLTEQTSKAR